MFLSWAIPKVFCSHGDHRTHWVEHFPSADFLLCKTLHKAEMFQGSRVVVQACKPSTREADLCVSKVYTESSRQDQLTQWGSFYIKEWTEYFSVTSWSNLIHSSSRIASWLLVKTLIIGPIHLVVTELPWLSICLIFFQNVLILSNFF